MRVIRFACVGGGAAKQVKWSGKERGLQKGASIDTQLMKGFIVLPTTPPPPPPPHLQQKASVFSSFQR